MGRDLKAFRAKPPASRGARLSAEVFFVTPAPDVVVLVSAHDVLREPGIRRITMLKETHCLARIALESWRVTCHEAESWLCEDPVQGAGLVPAGVLGGVSVCAAPKYSPCGILRSHRDGIVGPMKCGVSRRACDDLDRLTAAIVAGESAGQPALVRRFLAQVQRYVLGRELVWRRCRLGLTQVELATRAGVRQRDVSLAETGDPAATLECVVKLSAALGAEMRLVDSR